jgi:hypothetical protein
MNERLREILEDAEVIFDNPDAHVPLALVSMEDFKLIAELIVRECVAVCQDTDGEDNIDAKSGRQDCAVEIREHFGVEE